MTISHVSLCEGGEMILSRMDESLEHLTICLQSAGVGKYSFLQMTLCGIREDQIEHVLITNDFVGVFLQSARTMAQGCSWSRIDCCIPKFSCIMLQGLYKSRKSCRGGNIWHARIGIICFAVPDTQRMYSPFAGSQMYQTPM